MIARVWRGATLAEDADAYAAYLEETGMRAARKLAGRARHARPAARDGDRYAEFETILLFDSLDDVRAFAGDDLEARGFFPEDDRFLVERELEVSHYEVDVQLWRSARSGTGPVAQPVFKTGQRV